MQHDDGARDRRQRIDQPLERWSGNMPPTDSPAPARTFTGLRFGAFSSAASARPQTCANAMAEKQVDALMMRISLRIQTGKCALRLRLPSHVKQKMSATQP
ncbi:MULTISPECIES: hypothetical protein [unclassified Bradyrhizobium]